ncbi:GNAT family N-acetyltransferase [Thiorhodovibrio winogradskyi]|uniref:GNAT family N-acetyltransferase n=1 Tax=Thiorhodovibrio winogradskyi TaxID=77007 RepID=UPI002E2C005F|nr:GNAT family N-acetyltransferase [Thiorhodovibrio winogradskyi]
MPHWARQPPRGELVGLSAALDGNLIGLAIAERLPEGARLCSLVVLPAWQRQGVDQRLITELQPSLGMALLPNTHNDS